MQLEIFNDFSTYFEESDDFKHLLEYTFQLDYLTAFNELMHSCPYSDNSAIDYMFAQCHALCAPLFHDRGTHTYFGDSLTIKKGKQKETPYADLNFDDNFWTSAINNHCVVSALYTLLSWRLKGITITGYKLFNLFADKGYFTYKDDFLVFSKEGQLNAKGYCHSDSSAIYSNNSAGFSTSYPRYCRKLSNKEIGIFFKDPEFKKSFVLLYSGLFYRIYDAFKTGARAKDHLQLYESSTPLKSFNNFNSINKELQNCICANTQSDIVDNILLRYMAERFYNFSLNGTILEAFADNIHQKTSPMPFSIIETVLDFYLLPNVFSRDLFFKYALESYNNDSLGQSIFYLRMANVGPVTRLGTPTLDIDRLMTWQDLCKRFNRFYTRIIFPIYERTFFIMLMDYARTMQPSDINEYAINLLHDYLKDHASEIMAENIESTLLQGYPSENGGQKNKAILEPPEQENLSVVTRELLSRQNSIIHPSLQEAFNIRSLGIFPTLNSNYNPAYKSSPKFLTNDYHRQLISLLVESMLHRSDAITRANVASPNHS